jgi:hypothetical protein
VSAQTLAAIRRALVAAGVIFVEENGDGPGVRLRKKEGRMIYTVGLISIYEPRLKAGTMVKRGPGVDADGKPYKGGWVWETAEAAKAYLVERNSVSSRRVYGVLADWNTDTRVVPGEPTRCLTRHALVVGLG